MATTNDQAPKMHSVVLIVEDEPEIAEILSAYLSRYQLRPIVARDGRNALEVHLSVNPDLVILDVQLPKLDGWMVLAEIRRRGSTPVIMLTAMDQDVDKLMGLRAGADDYVIKPFNPAEVVARVQAVLRRASSSNSEGSKVLRTKLFQINLDTHEAILTLEQKEHKLTLTLTEFRILQHMVRMPQKVFSRSELLVACLPEGDALERTVDSHVSKLRRKLEEHGVLGVPESVRGVGYRLESAV